MSHERTVAQFVAEIEHITGRRILVRWMPSHGLYLQDVETGSLYFLGEGSRWRILTATEQEMICLGLHLPEMLDLLGFNQPQDD